MMKLNRVLGTAAIAVALCLSTTQMVAQDNANPPGGGPPGPGNFDPAQMRQRMMDNLKEQLEVTNDAEWKVIQPLIQNVMDARMAIGFGGMGRGMFGRGNRSGGDNAQTDRGPRRGGFGTPSPEAEALQKAIEAKASKAELKVALQKYLESRKTKQAELEAAQAKLRAVLTPRQEAIAALAGML
jgi:hypothetical protein